MFDPGLKFDIVVCVSGKTSQFCAARDCCFDTFRPAGLQLSAQPAQAHFWVSGVAAVGLLSKPDIAALQPLFYARS